MIDIIDQRVKPKRLTKPSVFRIIFIGDTVDPILLAYYLAKPIFFTDIGPIPRAIIFRSPNGQTIFSGTRWDNTPQANHIARAGGGLNRPSFIPGAGNDQTFFVFPNKPVDIFALLDVSPRRATTQSYGVDPRSLIVSCL